LEQINVKSNNKEVLEGIREKIGSKDFENA